MLPAAVRYSPFAARRLMHMHEPHPFLFYPKTAKPMPASIRPSTTRSRRAASKHFPVAIGIFGWVLAGAVTINWSRGVSNKGLWSHAEGPKEEDERMRYVEVQ